MKKIFILTDYKNIFGSKWSAKPYRNGFNLTLIVNYFKKYDYETKIMQIKDIDLTENWKGKIVLYTSSEERKLNYKDFIEDIILGLTKAGALVIPSFDFLRANNNKVYMEILLEQLLGEELRGNKSKWFGTFEELYANIDNINLPCVIKKAAGALSRGVFLATNKKELIFYAKKVSRSKHFLAEFKEYIRKKRHPGYKPESKYQHKFIIQKFIPNLNNDWKILIYGNHYYILNRGIKSNDFRASGSHHNYKAGSNSEFPIKLLDKVQSIYHKLNTPHLSVDFAYDGSETHIHEIQAVHFGTSTFDLCKEYYTKVNNKWIFETKTLDIEEEYVRGLIQFLERN